MNHRERITMKIPISQGYRLAEGRRLVRAFLRAIRHVPFRPSYCDHSEVDRLGKLLSRWSGWRKNESS